MTRENRLVSAPRFTFIDLFAGIGGFHLALSNIGGECVFASEMNTYARATYEANWMKESPRIFDGFFNENIQSITRPSDEATDDEVRDSILESIPPFDIVTGGFPCQPFSHAGFKRGFQDPGRGNLFFDIARIIDVRRPPAFFLENVVGLLNHDEGRTLATIRSILTEELGYSLHVQTIRASSYGLPQHRPRLYMVGFRNPEIPFNFPSPVPLSLTMSDIFEAPVNRDVGFTLRVGGRGSGLNDRHNWDCYLVNGVERRLGVREGKRMMGFPDSFEFPVSERQAMKQLGNAVAVPAIQATATEILSSLGV